MTTLSADRPWIEDRSRVVRDVFERERSNLLPLPDEHFPVHDRLDWSWPKKIDRAAIEELPAPQCTQRARGCSAALR